MQLPCTLTEFLVEEVKRLHSAETQLTNACPRFAERASLPALKYFFQEELWESCRHASRLREIAQALEASERGCVSVGVADMIAEADDQALASRPDAGQAALLAAAKKLCAYKSAGYANAELLAHEVEWTIIAELLHLMRLEEIEAARKLARLHLPEPFSPDANHFELHRLLHADDERHYAKLVPFVGSAR